MAKEKRRGRGEGSVEHLGDGRWRVAWSQGVDPSTGKRKRKAFYGKTKAEALAKLRKAQAVASGEHELTPDTSSLTLSDWLDKWLQTQKTAVEPKTYFSQEQIVRLALKPTLGEVKLGKLTLQHVKDMYATLTNEVSADRARRAGKILSSVLREAIRHKFITYNPVPDAKPPRHRRKEKVVLSPEQVPVFLKAAEGNRLYPWFALGIDSGCRPGELNALHWPQVNLGEATISIIQSLEEVAGKSRLKAVKTAKGRRTISISAAPTVEVLRVHREHLREAGRDVTTGLVFPNERGRFLGSTTVLRQLRAVLRGQRQGVAEVTPKLPPLTPYSLRHTCATVLLAAGVNIKIVSERLGHASIQITLDHYAHVLEGQQAVAAAVIGRIMTGRPPVKPLGEQNTQANDTAREQHGRDNPQNG